MKKVSVCMLAYNTGRFIEKAIESVLSQQTNFDYEIVIAEDKSTDNTKQIAESYKLKYPDKIKLILNTANLGLSGNYISAFKNCSAEYIAILDSDDYWCDTGKLQRQVDFLESNREYGVVYSDFKTVNEEGAEAEWEEIEYLRTQFSSGDIFFKLLKESAFIPALTTCFRKALIAEELEKSDLWFFEDWWLWMRIAIKSKFYFMNSQTSCYRLHNNNITKTRVENKGKTKQYMRKSYNIIYSNVIYFDRYNHLQLQHSQKELLMRRILMLLNRPLGNMRMKMKLFPLLFKYYPGAGSVRRMMSEKWAK